MPFVSEIRRIVRRIRVDSSNLFDERVNFLLGGEMRQGKYNVFEEYVIFRNRCSTNTCSTVCVLLHIFRNKIVRNWSFFLQN